MNYTLAGIRNRILIDKLDDEDFEPSVVDNFINDTLLDIYSEYTLPFTEKIFTGDLPAGVTMFEFPEDVSSIQAMIVTDSEGRGKRMERNFIRFEDFIQSYPTPESNEEGNVDKWTLYGDKMIVSRPIPANCKLTIYYNKVPRLLLADDDIPEFPIEFQEAVVLGAYYRVQLREGDSDEGLLTKSEYQRKMEQMVNRYGYRMNAGPIKMGNRQRGR